MIDLKTAAVYSLAAGCAVLLCRALPFLLIRRPKDGRPAADLGSKAGEQTGGVAGGMTGGRAGGSETFRRKERRDKALGGFLSLIERAAPPVTMTVLVCNSIAAPIKEDPRTAVPVLSATALSLVVQLWKGSFLLSILGGTALYMLLTRLPSGW